MDNTVTLAVDAMGGDHAPDVVIEGVKRALDADSSLRILLCGAEDVVASLADTHERCVAIPTTEVIGMAEHPANAVRTKKDSSIVRGCRLVKDGQADGFFSAGSTGACLAAATLIMGRAKGVKRPALGIILPAYEHPVLFVDVGANADCKPEYLVQFAQMGAIYLQAMMGVDDPRVGLLNIGEEDTKGSAFAQEAYQLLAASSIAFAGNCEGDDLMTGAFDVVVTDGFTGNVCLKTIEGTAGVLLKQVKDALTSGLKAKMGAALVQGSLSELKAKMNPDAYGGSPLLGVKGTCIVGHGSSNADAIMNGILVGAVQVREGVAARIAQAFDPSSEAEIICN